MSRLRVKVLTHEMTTRMQFIRFLFVGGLNTLFGYLCYAMFIYLNFSYPVAMLFASFLGIVFNFITTGRIVFRRREKGFFPRFLAGCIVAYGISVSLLWMLTFILANEYLAGLIIVLPMAIISFLLNKHIVFTSVGVLSE